jgi:ferritin
VQLSSVILGLLNKQYGHENRNYFLYKQRQSWADFRGLSGVADFFKQEAFGEHEHSEIVADYIFDRNEELTIAPFLFDIPDLKNDDLISLFTTALEVERGTTAALYSIYSAAQIESDWNTCAWLFDKLIPFQIEEEKTYQTILDRYVRYPDSPSRDTDFDVWIAENLVK